jgi:hypothetical protein
MRLFPVFGQRGDGEVLGWKTYGINKLSVLLFDDIVTLTENK